MSETSPPKKATLRSEKMGLLSAMLGPEALARLRQEVKKSPDIEAHEALDPDRAAWHRNKLLERLRQQQSGTMAPVSEHRVQDQPEPRLARPAVARPATSIDARIASHASKAGLQDEHPAVIARLLRGLDRADRIRALKTLPGPLARSVVQRLR